MTRRYDKIWGPIVLVALTVPGTKVPWIQDRPPSVKYLCLFIRSFSKVVTTCEISFILSQYFFVLTPFSWRDLLYRYLPERLHCIDSGTSGEVSSLVDSFVHKICIPCSIRNTQTSWLSPCGPCVTHAFSPPLLHLFVCSRFRFYHDLVMIL